MADSPSGRSGVAVRTFDRLVEACRRADDETYLLALRRLLDGVSSITELAMVVDEIVADGKAWFESNSTAENTLRSAMIAFRQDLPKQLSQLEASANVVPAKSPGDLDFAYQWSLARFDKIADQKIIKSTTLDPDRFENQSSTKTLQTILARVITPLEKEGEEPDETTAAIFRAVRDFGARVTWLHRERMNQIRSSPFVAWVETSRSVAAINPEPEPEPKAETLDIQQLFGEALESIFEIKFEKVLYGVGSKWKGEAPTKEELDVFRAWRTDLDYRLGLLRDEIALRLDLRRSVDTSLSRYAARSMWHRRAWLRELIAAHTAKGTRQIERLLVSDAAAYLFDQGFCGLPRATCRRALGIRSTSG